MKMFLLLALAMNYTAAATSKDTAKADVKKAGKKAVDNKDNKATEASVEDTDNNGVVELAKVFDKIITSNELDIFVGMYIQQNNIDVKSPEELNKYKKEALQELITSYTIRNKNPEMINDMTVQVILTQMLANISTEKKSQEILSQKDMLEKYYTAEYLKELDLPMLYTVMSCSFETEAQAKQVLSAIADGKTPEAATAALNKQASTKYTFKDIDTKQNEDGYSSCTLENLNASKPIKKALLQYQTPISNTVHNSVITLHVNANVKKNTPYVVLFIKEVSVGTIDDFPGYNHDRIGRYIAKKYITNQIKANIEEYKKTGEIEIYNTKKSDNVKK